MSYRVEYLDRLHLRFLNPPPKICLATDLVDLRCATFRNGTVREKAELLPCYSSCTSRFDILNTRCSNGKLAGSAWYRPDGPLRFNWAMA
jgi:hypothetical protein